MTISIQCSTNGHRRKLFWRPVKIHFRLSLIKHFLNQRQPLDNAKRQNIVLAYPVFIGKTPKLFTHSCWQTNIQRTFINYRFNFQEKTSNRSMSSTISPILHRKEKKNKTARRWADAPGETSRRIFGKLRKSRACQGFWGPYP